MITGMNLPSKAQLYVGKACIANPNDKQFDPNGIEGNGNGQGGMDQSCDEPTYFFEYSKIEEGTWNWDLGNGIIFSNSETRSFYYPYSQPGSYTVSVEAIDRNNPGNHFTYSQQVEAGYYPSQPMFRGQIEADTTICGGSTITLNPYKLSIPPSGVEYKWFPNGETTRTIEVDEPGCYSVEVIDPITGCSRSAKINVQVCYEEPQSSGGSEEWFFGHGASMGFNLTGTIVEPDPEEDEGSIFPEELLEDPSYVGETSSDTKPLRAEEASAVVLNQGGGVVLYSDGHKIYSGEDDSEIPLVDGGEFSLDNKVGAQGVVLIPKPICGSCNFMHYYLFTADEDTGLLSYSIIDMRENDQKGAVISQSIPLAMDVKGKMAIERSGDDESFILTFYNDKIDELQHIHIDSVGIFSPLSPNGKKDNSIQSTGYITISEDGRSLAQGQVVDGENVIKIYQRNPDNGQLSTVPKTIPLNITAPPTVYGLAFSPNGNRLYVSLNGKGTTDSKLIQINLEDDTLEEISSSKKEFGALALGPKYGVGKKFIYLAIKDSKVIHYIQEPNEVGKNAVGFTMNSANPGIEVAGEVKLGFPNVAAPAEEGDGGGLSAQYAGTCINAPTIFTMEEICQPFDNDITWIIEGKTYKGQQVQHSFSKEGWHDVILKIDIYKLPPDYVGGIAGMLIEELLKHYCTTVADTGKVYIKPAPFVEVPDPLYVCTEEGYYTKYAPEPIGGENFEYRWMTGMGIPIQPPEDALPHFEFKVVDPVQVEITNNFRCKSLYKFNVQKGCEPILEVPNVITPNGDKINDDLDIVYKFIEDYRLEIYNRWGERIFETDNFDVKWDGKVNGRTYPDQLYAYAIRYFARDFPDRKAQKKTGSILVLSE